MKNGFFFLSFFSLTTAFAAPVVGGKAPVKKMEIYCHFLSDESKFLDATGYANSASEDILFAEAIVYSQAGNRKNILQRYHLNYVPAKGLSLIVKFENTQKNITLEAFGDDMGGMSSLTVNEEQFDLTCTFQN